MKKKQLAVLLCAAALAGSLAGGCRQKEAQTEETQTQEPQVGEESGGEEETESDQEAADRVAALIDQIYVQERTEDTDELCRAAREAWDELTDAQKELVSGTFADPDYFGRDTGDASLDDPRNGDDIGENELLVVSFGTSFNHSRVSDIKGIEDALQEAYQDWSVRRAFTSQIIINHIQSRDGERIDNMQQALERAVDNGVKNLVIQPTHLMHGAEYDELVQAVEAYEDQFEFLGIGEPLLGEVGADASVVNQDKEAVAQAVVAQALQDAGYESVDEAAEDKTAFVLLGHGTSHTAKVSYSQMQTQMNALGYENVWIGTVEGEPEETSCQAVMADVAAAGYTNVVLRPLMVVAGDHANNDMAGDEEDSWKRMFEDSGSFEQVETQIAGLGEIPAVQEIYIAHAAAAMKGENQIQAEGGSSVSSQLEDGIYTADFDTDSGMFHVNEACAGKGTLTVEKGVMTIHVSLASKNIVSLYPGLAEDAQKEGAQVLEPVTDTVTYSDGSSEEVYGFDVPVPALDQEFDLALKGTKGVWYDHKVSVSNPEKAE